jgi:peptide deformylase
MAIRNSREEGDEILRKRAKEVDVINDKLIMLVKDMARNHV